MDHHLHNIHCKWAKYPDQKRGIPDLAWTGMGEEGQDSSVHTGIRNQMGILVASVLLHVIRRKATPDSSNWRMSTRYYMSDIWTHVRIVLYFNIQLNGKIMLHSKIKSNSLSTPYCCCCVCYWSLFINKDHVRLWKLGNNQKWKEIFL